jgi:hypothetical protein
MRQDWERLVAQSSNKTFVQPVAASVAQRKLLRVVVDAADAVRLVPPLH